MYKFLLNIITRHLFITFLVINSFGSTTNILASSDCSNPAWALEAIKYYLNDIIELKGKEEQNKKWI